MQDVQEPALGVLIAAFKIPKIETESDERQYDHIKSKDINDHKVYSFNFKRFQQIIEGCAS